MSWGPERALPNGRPSGSKVGSVLWSGIVTIDSSGRENSGTQNRVGAQVALFKRVLRRRAWTA
jgi:hypothetical protein